MMRWAMAVARCSSATLNSPSAQRSPIERRAGDTSVVSTPEGSRPPPRRPSTNHQAPALSPANRRASSACRVPLRHRGETEAYLRPFVASSSACTSLALTRQTMPSCVAGSFPVRT